jgi:cytochrome b
MNWFTNHAFGSHPAEWLALAVVILLALELCTGTLEFVSSLLTHERDAAESEKDYWRIHGGE